MYLLYIERPRIVSELPHDLHLITLAERGFFDVIVHGCNLKGIMGAGIAREIADKYPEAAIADRGSLHLPFERLGTYTMAGVRSPLGHEFIIVNAYTQRDTSRRHRQVDYNAVANAFSLVAQNFEGKRIAYPRVGAGLAGGDWNILDGIIQDALANVDHTLVEYIPE